MKKIVAITACPNGIAQTYYAEAILKKYALKYNFDIKVETHGLKGTTLLSIADISEAELVLIASDVVIKRERFVSKKILEVSVGYVIRKTDKLFKQMIKIIDAHESRD